MWYKKWAQVSFVLSQITRLTDRSTDRQTASFIVTRPRCIQYSAVIKRRLCLLQTLFSITPVQPVLVEREVKVRVAVHVGLHLDRIHFLLNYNTAFSLC